MFWYLAESCLLKIWLWTVECGRGGSKLHKLLIANLDNLENITKGKQTQLSSMFRLDELYWDTKFITTMDGL